MSTAVRARESETGTRAFVTDLRGLAFGAAEVEPLRIEVCRDGVWRHPKWGEIRVDAALRESFVRNHAANVRRCGDLPLDYDHEPGPAPGWITGLQCEGSSLFATVVLTPAGREKVRGGEYRFFSPEWHPNWQDPETGEQHGPTLFGGGLTNRPFFRGMAAINCGEDPPRHLGSGSGVEPQKEAPLGDNTEQPGIPAAGCEPPTAILAAEAAAASMAAAEVEALRARVTAVEAENAELRAAERRRDLAQVFAELRFDEGGRRVLAPASRRALVELAARLPVRERCELVEAVRGLQLAELGSRVAQCVEDPFPDLLPELLPAQEDETVRATAERNGRKYEELRASYLEVKRRRAGAVRGGEG